MKKNKRQNQLNHSVWKDLSASVTHAAQRFVGHSHLFSELSSAAAHYDGLIDSIERAGWDLDRLGQVKHVFDATARSLMNELVESYPDMSETEQQSFLAPFQSALYQFSQMSTREKEAFRAEYNRFANLQAQTVKEFATQEA